MDIPRLLKRLHKLEERVRVYEAKELQWQEEKQHLLDKVAELEEALKHKADSKASKNPRLPYGVDRHKHFTQFLRKTS